MKICFRQDDRWYCVWIPIFVWPPWPPRPNGDPWRHIGDWLEDPSPEPWKENLTLVAQVAALAQHAKGDLKRRLDEVVDAETAAIQKQLPEGVKLELGGKAS